MGTVLFPLTESILPSSNINKSCTKTSCQHSIYWPDQGMTTHRRTKFRQEWDQNAGENSFRYKIKDTGCKEMKSKHSDQ